MKMSNIKILLYLGIMLLLPVMFSFITGVSTCFSWLVFGIPCPVCGMTRAWLSFMKWDLLGAIKFHPLFPLAIVIPMPFMIYKNKKFTANHKKIIFSIIIVAFLIVWILRMLLYFPNSEPMEFNENSILSILLDVFYKWECFDNTLIIAI